MTHTKEKHEIDNLNASNFQYANNLTRKDLRLLMEAFRRKHLMEKECDPKFLGLGTPSTYKSKFFTPSFNELSRVNNWYTLSQRGEEMMLKMESYFEIPKDGSKANGFLFSFS